jgi:3-methyladenine DNA glycosylase/8-oxoguanine DNA glycosylase
LKEIAQRRTFIVEVKQPFSFALTIKKPAGWNWITPYEIVGKNMYWSTLRLQDGELVGVKLTEKGEGIEAAVYSDRELTEDQSSQISSHIEIGLGANIDLEEFYTLAKEDSILRLVVQDLYGMKPYFADSIFERALLAICLQMAPIKRSDEMLDCLIKSYGENLTFDGKKLRHWPSPSRLRSVAEKELKDRCKLGYRAKFVSELSKVDGIPDAKELWQKPTGDAIKQLTRLPGIGKYSAGILLAKNTFPVDVWSSGIFYKLFFGKATAKPREVIGKVIEEAERRYKKWKWEAFAYVLNDLPRLEPIIQRT